MNTSMQLKALIRNLSKRSNVEAEILLRNFMLERLLERIAVSDYKYNFILKGGMLIAAMVGVDTRATMDMDATIKGQSLTSSEITAVIEDILRIRIDDGVEFTLRGTEEIREEADYPCYRVSIGAVFDKTRQTIKVDITTGDIITPREIEYNFNLMFDDRSISIMAYNLETFLSQTKLPIFGTFMDGKNIYQEELPKEGIIIMGNEANGISTSVEKLVSERIAIPRFGNLQVTESLNVATATAIILSEFKRK